MIIQVLKEDIDLGIRKSCHFCPISLAVQRALSNRYVSVCATEIRAYKKESEKADALWVDLYVTPKEAIHFMNSFDSGFLVEPFSFELDDNPKRINK